MGTACCGGAGSCRGGGCCVDASRAGVIAWTLCCAYYTGALNELSYQWLVQCLITNSSASGALHAMHCQVGAPTRMSVALSRQQR
jgi:hypothetical protein